MTKKKNNQASKDKKVKQQVTVDKDIDILFLELEKKQKKGETKKEKIEKEKTETEKTETRSFPWFFVILGILATAIIVFFLFFFYKYDRLVVSTNSMGSTLGKENKILYQDDLAINRFNIVVVEKQGKTDILRVIGMPGDSVSLTDDILKINDAEYDEDYLKRNYITFKAEDNNLNQNYTENFDLSQISGKKAEKQNIPRDKYLLLGDNRTEAIDSRKVGYYDESDIKGTVLLKLSPFKEFGPVE